LAESSLAVSNPIPLLAPVMKATLLIWFIDTSLSVTLIVTVVFVKTKIKNTQ
jgi:hypothetical protein